MTAYLTVTLRSAKGLYQFTQRFLTPFYRLESLGAPTG